MINKKAPMKIHSTPLYTTLISAVVALGSVALSSTSALAASYDFTVTLETKNQSLFGEGPAVSLDYSHTILNNVFDKTVYASTGIQNPHGSGWKECPFFGGGCVQIVPDWDLGYWGAEITARAKGDLKIVSEGHFTTGDVSLRYPINFRIDAPASARPGDWVRVLPNYTVSPDASLTTRTPSASYSLKAVGNLNLGVDGKACAGDCLGVNIPIVNTSFNRDLIPPLNASKPSLEASGMVGDVPFRGSAHLPSIISTGTLREDIRGKGTVYGESSGSFAEVALDLDQIVSMATGIPLNASVDVDPLSLSINTINADVGIALGLKHEFSFQAAGPELFLSVKSGDRYIALGSVADGQEFGFTMPDGDVAISASGWMNSSIFQSQLMLEASLIGNLDLLAIKAGVTLPDDLGGPQSMDIGPLVDWGFNLPVGGGILLSRNAFTLKGEDGEQLGSNFSLGTFNVAVVPEPKTYAMLLAGLGLVSMKMRRRMSGIKNLA